MVPGSRILMWLNYRQSGNNEATVAVPAPVDKATPNALWWYDEICHLAPKLAAMGITDVLFPNPVIGEGAPGSGDDGYNPFDDYDIGGKGTPTRSGTREQFQRAVAVCHANGLNVLLDIVLHQRMGAANGIYKYKSATGKTNGRFEKTPTCFRWNGTYGVNEDPVPDVPDDFAFGDELAPVNALPSGYVWNGLLAANGWLFHSSGADGGRLDDMKGIAVSFMNAFLTSEWATGKFFFGEYDDGNTNDLNWWLSQVQGRCSATDFAFQENIIEPMCQRAGAGNWSMAWGVNQGLIRSNPMKSVPFVESMDSDTDGWATIVDNKSLGIACLLASEGMPLLYIKDYLVYGLTHVMENMSWVHQMLANGGTDTVYADNKTWVFRRTGSPGLLMALNNDVWNTNWTTVTCRSDFPAGTVLHDYTGKNGQDCTVDQNGNVTFGIPPARNGEGYGAWAPRGITGKPSINSRHTTQVFYGAADLDIGPITNGTLKISPRIYVAANSNVSMRLSVDTSSNWTATSVVLAELADPNGSIIGGTRQSGTETADLVNTKAMVGGWYTLSLTGTNVTDPGASFSVSVTYTAPTTI